MRLLCDNLHFIVFIHSYCGLELENKMSVITEDRDETYLDQELRGQELFAFGVKSFVHKHTQLSYLQTRIRW